MNQIRLHERLAGIGIVLVIAGIVFFTYDVYFQPAPNYYVQVAAVSSSILGFFWTKKSIRKLDVAIEAEELRRRYSD